MQFHPEVSKMCCLPLLDYNYIAVLEKIISKYSFSLTRVQNKAELFIYLRSLS